MAYVAISRVRTLKGLYLTAFDPVSIRVDTSCLDEVNRLRSQFRKDLAPYQMPVAKTLPVERSLIDISDTESPLPKKPKVKVATKRTLTKLLETTTTAMKTKSTGNNTTNTSCSRNNDCAIARVDRPRVPRSEWPDYRYYPVNVEWQRQLAMCSDYNSYVHSNGLRVDQKSS